MENNIEIVNSMNSKSFVWILDEINEEIQRLESKLYNEKCDNVEVIRGMIIGLNELLSKVKLIKIKSKKLQEEEDGSKE